MANVDIRIGYKDSAWFTTNATLVLKQGQIVHLQQTGQYKIGNGVTQLSALAFLGSSVIATETQLVTATVVNKTGVNLLASNYQAVKVSTAQGQRLAVNFAQANNDNNSVDTIGLVRENISNNQEGDVVILGQIVEVNTTGSLQGETWADGDVLYLSPTTAGRITNIKPTGLTGHIVVIGYVEYAHAIHGKIYTKIMNGWEVEELHNVADVSYTTPIDADSLLIKDSTASLWKRLTWANLKANFLTPIATAVGAVINFEFKIPNNTNQTASANIPSFKITGNIKQWLTGTISNQYWNYFTSNTASFSSASTITNSYGLYVEKANTGSNATITNNYAIGGVGEIFFDYDNTGKTIRIGSWAGGSFPIYGWGIDTYNNEIKLPHRIYIGDVNYYIGRFNPATGPIGPYGGSFNTYTDFQARSIVNSRVYLYGVDSTGNVGINTTTPTAKLEVNGDFKTAQPSANGAGAWKLGKKVTATVTMKTTEYIEVDIDGVIYKLALVN